jgi:hypothetical protein
MDFSLFAPDDPLPGLEKPRRLGFAGGPPGDVHSHFSLRFDKLLAWQGKASPDFVSMDRRVSGWKLQC